MPADAGDDFHKQPALNSKERYPCSRRERASKQEFSVFYFKCGFRRILAAAPYSGRRSSYRKGAVLSRICRQPCIEKPDVLCGLIDAHVREVAE